MGGAEIDLRGVTLDPTGAHLQVKTYLGGTEIIVPDDWRVVFDSRSYLGGAECARPAGELAEDAPTLTIEALTVMGGVDVSRKPPERTAGE
jgi:predicted membrane protein